MAILGYWAIRGLGEPIRLLHALLNLELVEHTYGRPFIAGATHDISSWPLQRAQLKTKHPNLPYYIDGATTICETLCILRYICKKHAPYLLHVPNETSKIVAEARHDETLQFIFESVSILRTFHYGYVPQSNTVAQKDASGRTGSLVLDAACYTGQSTSNIQDFFEERVATLLRAANPYIFGETPTLSDVVFYDLLDALACNIPNVHTLSSEVCDFRAAFRSIPQIKTYLDRRPSFTRNAPIAKFVAQIAHPSRESRVP